MRMCRLWNLPIHIQHPHQPLRQNKKNKKQTQFIPLQSHENFHIIIGVMNNNLNSNFRINLPFAVPNGE